MRKTEWKPARAFVVATLLLSAAPEILAQAGPSSRPVIAAASTPEAQPSGALAGRLTDLHSLPLAGVTIVLRNQATGLSLSTTTAKNGVYRFAALAPGVYSLQAQSAELGSGQLEDIRVDAGHEARVQAAMAFAPAISAPAAPSVDSRTAAVQPAPSLPERLASQTREAANPTPKSAAASRPEIHPLTASAETPLRPQQQMTVALSARLAAPRAEIPVDTPALPGRLPPVELALAPLASQSPVPSIRSGPRALPASAAAAQPAPAAAPVTTTLTGAQLQSLPVSGRRWQALFLDTPAAAPAASNAPVALRGAGQDPADTTVDGASTRLAFGSAAGSAASLPAQDPSAQNPDAARAGSDWSGGRGFAVSSAAIREVSIVAGNVEAQGAHAAGGRTAVETESGSNQLHGQGFFSDRQNTWGAQNPFTQWVQNTGTAAAPVFTAVPFTPPDHEMSWGFGAGSRIRRNRLFWFAALDGYRRNDPGLASVRNAADFFAQPADAQMQLLSAQLELPSVNPAAEGLAAYWSMLEQLAGLLGPAPRTAAQWVCFARLDWQAAERHRFTLEGTGADWSSPGGGLTRVSESYGNHSFGSSYARQQWLLARWEAFLTPNLLAVTQGSAGREVMSARPDTPSPFEQNFLGSAWNPYAQLPQIVVDSRYGFTIGNPARFGQGSYPDEHRIEAQEMLDWVRGKLLVKAGFQLDHDTDATTLLRNKTGTYTYSKVQDFISDALVFEKFGIATNGWQAAPGGGQTFAQHNCNPANNGLGALPCYSYFSQVMGPNFWQITTNDWAAYTTAQWQLNKFAVVSAGLRWDREQLPPPIALVANPALPETGRLPSLGNQWGPRLSLALGNRGRWPVLRLGYGMYFGRTENATVETALTQTGSLNGDLNFFIRPTDGYTSATNTSTAPAFPNVLTGPPGSVVVPGVVAYAPQFHNPQVHQALAAVEQQLPGRITVTASALLSLGRHLPVSIDTNFDPGVNPGAITYNVVDKTGLGPLKSRQITVPFYALWPSGDCGSALRNIAGQCGRLNPSYQQITQIQSRANSTYEAAMLRIARSGQRGLSLHAHYTYAHAMDWNPNESTTISGNDVLDPAHFDQEYGTSNLDVRHSAAVLMIYESPWKLRGVRGRFANGWMLSAIGQFRGGLPYTMRTTGAVPRELDTYGDPTIVGLGPGMNGSGGDNRVYGVGRNTFRYPDAWKADLRLGKKFYLREQREFELLAESFNLFNHQNVTEIETNGYEIEAGSAGSLPTLNYLTQGTTGTAATTPAFGQPFNINATDFYRERQIQLGARLRF